MIELIIAALVGILVYRIFTRNAEPRYTEAQWRQQQKEALRHQRGDYR